MNQFLIVCDVPNIYYVPEMKKETRLDKRISS